MKCILLYFFQIVYLFLLEKSEWFVLCKSVERVSLSRLAGGHDHHQWDHVHGHGRRLATTTGASTATEIGNNSVTKSGAIQISGNVITVNDTALKLSSATMPMDDTTTASATSLPQAQSFTNSTSTTTIHTYIISPGHVKSGDLHASSKVEFIAGGLPFILKCDRTDLLSPIWQKDGESMHSSALWHVQRNNVNVVHATEKHSGIYSCEILNGSHTLQLSVTGLRFEEPLLAQHNLQLGESLHVRCNVTGQMADHFTYVQWYREEKAITQTSCNVSGCVSSENGTLFVESFQQDTGGRYTCIATDGNHTISMSTELKLYAHVEFIHQLPSIVKVDHGSTLTLQCTVTGIPAPSIQWFFNNKPVLTKRSSLYLAVFQKSNVDINDAGVYTCIAANSMYLRKQTVHVNVKTVPAALDVSVEKMNYTTSVTLHWTVVDNGGYPIQSISIECIRDDNLSDNLPLVHNSTPDKHGFIITNLRANDNYTVVVWASNRLGQGSNTSVNFTTNNVTSFYQIANQVSVLQPARLLPFLHYVNSSIWRLAVCICVLLSIAVVVAVLIGYRCRRAKVIRKPTAHTRVRGDSESSDILAHMYSNRPRLRQWAFSNPVFQEEDSNDFNIQPALQPDCLCDQMNISQ